MPTIRYSGTLITCTCWCGMRCAIPTELYDAAQCNKNKWIYCPIGHSFCFTKNKATILEEKLDNVEQKLLNERRLRNQELASHDREVTTLTRRASAQKGANTRMKNRIAAGVCPCCNRTFQNLARHMGNKHPDFSRGD